MIILSVDDTSDVVQCSDGNRTPCNFVRSAEHLGSGPVVQPVAVLSENSSSTRDSGDILCMALQVQFSAVLVLYHHPLVTLQVLI